LSKAQEKIQRSSISNASVQHMDLTTSQQLIDCGFPEQYDWIMCCMTLHHLQDPMGKLELLKELLKPRGTLVIVEFGSNTSTGSAHSHAHHGHAHQHHHTQLSQQDREQGRHSDHRSSSNHGEDSHHDHAHAHAHSHHNPNDGESAKDATSHSNTKNEYKEKYGIFSDGFSSETLQQAFRKLGLSHCDVHELPSPEGLDEAHPFYGFPVMILFASSSYLLLRNKIKTKKNLLFVHESLFCIVFY